MAVGETLELLPFFPFLTPSSLVLPNLRQEQGGTRLLHFVPLFSLTLTHSSTPSYPPSHHRRHPCPLSPSPPILIRILEPLRAHSRVTSLVCRLFPLSLSLVVCLFFSRQKYRRLQHYLSPPTPTTPQVLRRSPSASFLTPYHSLPHRLSLHPYSGASSPSPRVQRRL